MKKSNKILSNYIYFSFKSMLNENWYSHYSIKKNEKNDKLLKV